jgi:uncharacterized membrane protein
MHAMPTSVLNVAAKAALPHRPEAIRRTADYIPDIRRNVGPTERLISLGLGGCLAAYALARRKVDPLALAAGGYLLYRGASGNCPVSQAVSSATHGDKKASVMPARAGAKVERAVTINRTAAELYAFWRNLAQLPRFMAHLKEVREIDHRKSHWVARGPMGISVEWDAEIITDTPNEVISWGSLPGSDVDTAGSVHFTAAPAGRGTEVRVSLKYDPPAGKAGAAIARLFGESPERQVEEDLHRFKQLMEAGEIPTTIGQPRGKC